jgi:uncharacterized protein YcbX
LCFVHKAQLSKLKVVRQVGYREIDMNGGLMHLAAIWRYPVKSMGGERLETVALSADGVHGDRIVQVFDRRGRIVTARSHPSLLGLHAVLGPDDEPVVDGHHWRTAEAEALVVAAVGAGAHMKQDDRHRFDILPLLVATDGALEAFGHDPRRLRPNLVIGDVDGLRERSWEGRRLRVGGAVVALEDLRGRCVMTTFDPDTQIQDAEVLKDIVRRFDGTFCLNASVATSAAIRVGDPVLLL